MEILQKPSNSPGHIAETGESTFLKRKYSDKWPFGRVNCQTGMLSQTCAMDSERLKPGTTLY